MSKRQKKLSARDLAALNAGGVVGVRYPPGGNRAEVRVNKSAASQARARRKP